MSRSIHFIPQIWPVSQTMLLKHMCHNTMLTPPCFTVFTGWYCSPDGNIYLSIIKIRHKLCTYTLGHWVFFCQCTDWRPWGTECCWWRISGPGNIPYTKSLQVYPTLSKPEKITSAIKTERINRCSLTASIKFTFFGLIPDIKKDKFKGMSKFILQTPKLPKLWEVYTCVQVSVSL